MQLWECEFCGTKNTVDIFPEDIPSHDDTSFIMSHPFMLQSKPGSKMNKDVMLVFCIDTSGSMCVTSKVRYEQKTKNISILLINSLHISDSYSKNKTH